MFIYLSLPWISSIDILSFIILFKSFRGQLRKDKGLKHGTSLKLQKSVLIRFNDKLSFLSLDNYCIKFIDALYGIFNETHV